MTKAERYLWNELRGRGAYAFRRQHTIEIGARKYIADFCCKEAMLIIEVDGASHDGQAARDAEREQDLRSMGFEIVRFSNLEALSNAAAVARGIFFLAQDRLKALGREPAVDSRLARRNGVRENEKTPHPNPLPKGRGD